MPVSLVTCVSNKGGLGPGHSCIDIDGKIFTFQGIDWGGDNSGWEQVARDRYLAKNAHRPVILQELTPAVHAGKVLDYILESIADDDDYLGSGVCSSQAASAIEAGYVQKEIEESAWRYQREIEEGERVIVGLNRFTTEETATVPVMKIDPEVDRRRAEEVRRYRTARDVRATEAALEALRQAARGEENLFPYVLEAFRAKATLGEVAGALREVWGEYQPGG